MKRVEWLVYIDPTNGKINSVSSVPGAGAPEEDSTTNDGQIIKHLVLADIERLTYENPAQFMDTHHWGGSDWVYRESKPSMYHDWSFSSSSWEFLSAPFLDKIRQDRNLNLGISDWTQVADSPLSDEKKVEWRTYRQQLRDLMANLPSDLDDLDDVSWPTKPS